MVEVFVSRLGLDSASGAYVVVLQEKNGDRILPIWIGKPEADSIVLHMHNVKRVRPITHDLVRSLIIGLGAQLRRAYISRIAEQTYFAELQLVRNDTLVNIDARPSDCIAIALRLDAPIFAAETLLAQPPNPADDESDVSDNTETAAEGSAEVDENAFLHDDPSITAEADLTAEQLKRYLDALRPEDFGKFKP